MSSVRRILLAAAAVLFGGCTASVEWLGVRMLYEPAAPAGRQVLDVTYRQGPGSDGWKHRLDLFLPEGEGWPVLVFVHGAF